VAHLEYYEGVRDTFDVVLYSKPDCHLCDEVKAQLKRLQERHNFEWREVSILEDSEAFSKYKDKIPVVFVHGRMAFKYRLDEKEFLKRLKNAEP